MISGCSFQFAAFTTIALKKTRGVVVCGEDELLHGQRDTLPQQSTLNNQNYNIDCSTV